MNPSPSPSPYRSRMPKYPTISEDPAVQRRYVACRQAGSSHRLSEMLALRRGPALNTDTRWLAGHVNGSQFAGSPREEAIGGYYQQVARAHGLSTAGKVYKTQLARFPGDPQAWVSSRADCIKVAAERGMTLEGSVNYKPPADDTPDSETPYRVADDLVDDAYEDLCAAEPDAAHLPAGEVKESIRQKLSPAAVDDE